MKQQISICASILAASLLTAPIQASPTVIISDGVTSTSFGNTNGIVFVNSPSDEAWSYVSATAESKPGIGSATSPAMDIIIQAMSLGSSPTRNLVVTFSDNGFSPTSSGLRATLTGHVVTGVGANITYTTYYDGANGQPTIVSNNTVLPGTAVALTTTGSLPAPTWYCPTNTCGAANQALYSLIEQVTISGSPGGSYSLDASLVPNNLHCGGVGVTITVPPQSLVTNAGAIVTFSVTATGTGPLYYQWHFNGANIPGATSPTLTLSFVGSANAGAYSVTVWNPYGSALSAAAQLTVSQPLVLPGTTLSPTVAETTPALAFSPSPSQLKTFVNGSFTSGGTLAPGEKTIVLTHGWIPAIEPFGLPGEGIGGWPTEMAKTLVSHGFGATANIVAWDWGDAAKSFPCDPGQVAGQTQFQGPALGQALAAALGTYYSRPIHFIGHSLGTLLNASAANYLHSSGFAPSNTHMTLFDEAEIAADTSCSEFFALALYASPFATQAPYLPLPAHFAWADNYVSLVGQLQSGAANVILTNGLPSSAPNLSGLIEEANAFHGYPMLWYEETIASPGGALMGFHWSFEEGGFSGAPAAGTVYIQAFNTSSLDLVQTNYANGTALINQRFPTYHTTIATLGATAVAPGQSSGGVSGQANYSEYDEVNMTVNLWTSAAVGPPTLGLPPHPLGTTPQDNSVTNVPACAWIPITIPSNAVAMSFNFLLQGNGQSDSFAAALNGTNVLAVAANLIQTNVTLSSGLIGVSQYSGQQVELFLGIVGGTSTNAAITVSNFQFYSFMQPVLQAQAYGSNLVITWPVSADGYALETSTNFTGTNSWAPVTNVAAIADFQNTVTNAISGGSRFYRLKRVP